MKSTALGDVLLAGLALLPAPALGGGINWDVFEYGVVDGFRWSRPFPDDGTDPGGFHVHCKAEATFHARMYRLRDLPDAPPAGLRPWHDGIEDFLGKRDFVGSFDGVDHKDREREIVVMEYVDVPEPVRHWIEEQQRVDNDRFDKKWLYGVFAKPTREGEVIHETVRPSPTAVADAPSHEQHDQAHAAVTSPSANGASAATLADKDKIVVFPAGALYEILPLWVSRGSKCERALSNLAKYKPQAEDDTILAWVTDHTKPDRDRGGRAITFTVEAMSVTESDEGKRARLMWEKLHRAVKRNERRLIKEERLKAKRELEEGRVKDEL